MDKAREFLLDIGYTSSMLHGVKAFGKIQKIAKYFGHNHAPHLDKQSCKDFLNEFFNDGSISSDRFGKLFIKVLSKKFSSQISSNPITAHEIVITNLPASKFYQSKEWRNLRYKVLKKRGNRCFACGRGPRDGVVIHVDHILPRSVHPDRALSFENMQILCEDCNLAKSNTDTTSWKDRG